MNMDDYRITNLVHIGGDKRHALIEDFLKARKAIGESDSLRDDSVDVFVFDSIKPPRIEKSEGMAMKMTCHDTVLIFHYDYFHGNKCFSGTHNCSRMEMIKFEKSYRRQAHLKKRKRECGILRTSCSKTTKKSV